jgi:hypothetical protein
MATPQERNRETDDNRERETGEDRSPADMHARQDATETDDATGDEFTKEAREMTETGPGRGAD